MKKLVITAALMLAMATPVFAQSDYYGPQASGYGSWSPGAMRESHWSGQRAYAAYGPVWRISRYSPALNGGGTPGYNYMLEHP